MTTLSEILVDIGVSTDDLTGGTAGAADDVERSLAGIGDAADRAARDVADAADAAAAAMGDVGAAADEAAQGAEQAAAETEGAFRGMAMAAAGAAVGALFIEGLTAGLDIKAASTKLKNQLDLSAEDAARAGDVAGDVYTAGFSDSIEGVNDALGAVVSNMGGMGKLGDAEMKTLTKTAIALADTFEFDVAESTQAAGTLIKTGLAKDGAEAMDLLAATAQKLPLAMREELPVLVREYGEFFDQLGFTGPEMMGLLTEAAKNPTFEIDKMGDALKEFTLLMADTDAVKEPLEELGLDVKDIQKLMNTGQGTEAFDQVITALKGVENQTERTKLQAALFGGPGEDMGNSLLNLKATGVDAASGLDDAANAAKNITDSVEQSKSLDTVWRQISTTLGELFLPALTKFSEFISENPALLKIAVPAFLTLAAVIGILVAAQWLWNAALWAWPGTWIIAGIIALIAIIALIIIKWDVVAAATAAAWDWIVGKLGAAWNWITEKVSSVWNWITEKTSAAWNAAAGFVGDAVDDFMDDIDTIASVPGKVGRWLGDVVNWVAGLPGRIGNAADGMWDSIVSGFKNAVNQLIWMWNSLSFTLGGGSFMGVGIPSMTLHTPDIPYLAEGGVTTGPTLAMIGEGREQEAVLPLSRLDDMLRSVAGPVARVEQGPLTVRTVLELAGADSEFKDFFQKVVRDKAGGSVIRFAEG
ncbi:phage tail tape measure protein [Streptomyces anulatus]|uniref:phage tail tape measure protein n=1 Tax=Streptomyces anulatus TaxID=1892 RepID=UPI001D1947D7|nr:phage tail tape measure protein [Streptomyces anulatus]